METRLPVEGSFGIKFPSIYNHCGVMAAWSRKALKKIMFLRFCWKQPLTGKYSQSCSEKNSSRHRSTCCVQISWNSPTGNR